MHLKRRANGWYYLTWYDGRQTRKVSLRTRDVEEAHRRAGETVDRIRVKRVAEVTPTVGEILRFYYKRRAPHVASADSLLRGVAKVDEGLGSLRPDQLSPDRIEAYVKARGIKPGSVRRELATLIAAFNLAARHRVIPKSAVPMIDLPPAPLPRDKWCRLEELDHLIATAEKLRRGDRLSRIERFLWIATETGARLQVITDLQWSAIDLRRGIVDYGHGQTRITKKRRPVVPISDRLMPVLERAYSERRGELVLDHTGSVRTALSTVCRAAEMPWVTAHVLRHSFASNAVMAGVPMVDVARVLGNSVEMVERTYSKWNDSYLKSAVNFRR